MKVLSYNYILPNQDGIIPELDRSAYMSSQYISLAQDYINTVKFDGKVAFLYAGGVMLSASEARNVSDKNIYREHPKPSGTGIRELAAYSMHRWIGMFSDKENIQYASINGNTCASSMFSLYEAEKLLNDGFDEVFILAEEKTSYSTLRVFDESCIDLKIGEGLAMIHLTKGDGISDCKWFYEYTRNPFAVTEYGYKNINQDCDYVNPHGTGTPINEYAESSVFQDTPQLRYKEYIGHTQGVSGLLEVCMILDENIKGKVLCVSSGLGGFYGSCIVQK